MAYEGDELLDEITNQEYKYGFVTNIESDMAPKGLNEDIIRFISAKKNEPDWLLEWRLKAFDQWKKRKTLIQKYVLFYACMKRLSLSQSGIE